MLKIWKREVFNINTKDLQSINKIHNNQYKIICEASVTDIDNNADTHCFGSKLCPILFTSEEGTVSPLLTEYTEQVNVPIYTVANVLTLDS